MEIIRYPKRDSWDVILKRPIQNPDAMEQTINPILHSVKIGGDRALRRYSEIFDNVQLEIFKVSQKEIENAVNKIDEQLIRAVNLAAQNIKKFHLSQIIDEPKIETSPGVFCWRRSVPIEKIGLYIPGGTAPLYSSVLMLGIPAKEAGCKEIVLCTPPDKKGKVHPAILYTANLVGIKNIYMIGGAQAIAAMAFGTETVPQVYKIFGPGNQYVTAAKLSVSGMGVAIDMPAGPSELVILADGSANPKFIAADLLSQAEHGADSQVVLVTDQSEIIEDVQNALNQQSSDLPRNDIIAKALQESKFILMENVDQALDLINFYAPEHLILMVKDQEQSAAKVLNAGSVFLGNYSPESAGDYASGTNHVLPTSGFSRSYSGVSIESFMKKITFQELSPEGLKNIGPVIESMAEAEQLIAHKQAVSIRLNELKKE